MNPKRMVAAVVSVLSLNIVTKAHSQALPCGVVAHAEAGSLPQSFPVSADITPRAIFGLVDLDGTLFHRIIHNANLHIDDQGNLFLHGTVCVHGADDLLEGWTSVSLRIPIDAFGEPGYGFRAHWEGAPSQMDVKIEKNIKILTRDAISEYEADYPNTDILDGPHISGHLSLRGTLKVQVATSDAGFGYPEEALFYLRGSLNGTFTPN